MWQVDVTVETKDPSNPDTILANNTRSAKFEVIFEPTATLLALFRAEPVSEGLEVRWRFAEPALVADVRLERGAAAEGPWAAVSAERREQSGTTVVLDRNVTAGTTYHYRLLATLRSGETFRSEALAATSGLPITSFALVLSPNPSRGATRVDYAVPRTAPVRLSVVDVQGRELALLAEGSHRAGRYQAVWDGYAGRGNATAGLYFVRYQTPGSTLVRRLVLMR
jgi:hypothetical protein